MSTRPTTEPSAPPRATRTRTRRPRAEREAQILEAARRIFSEKGYGEATVAEIASGAGVVEGTVYSYFPSKRALLIAVMRVFFESLIAETETGLGAVRGVENQLRFVIRKQLEIFASDFGLCRVILREARPDLTLYDEAILELNRRYTGLALRVLEEGVATGVLRENIVPSVIRDLIYGGIEHAVWRFVFSERELDVATLSDQLADSILGGIVCPSPDALPEHSETLARLERIAGRLEVSLERTRP